MIACLSIPYFAVGITRQRETALAETPLIVGEPAMRRVFAVSPEAGQAGVRPGMPLHQAQALVPQAWIEEANQAAYQQALDALVILLADFSPQVEVTEAGQRLVCFLDLGILAHNNVPELIQVLGQAVREGLALPSALGLDSGKFTAQMAAQVTKPNRARLIQPGREAAFLAPLSINHLPIQSNLKQHLHLLGWHSIGQVAVIPAKTLLNQFGYEGRQLHQLANGIDQRPVATYVPQQTETITHQADTPIASWLVLEALLRQMIGKLTTQLQAKGQAGRALGLRLTLDDETHLEQQGILSQPSNEVGRLGQAFMGLLSQGRTQSGVNELTLTISDLTPALGQQLDLFVHQSGQQSRLKGCLPDLTARYGSDVFYLPRIADEANDLPERRFSLQGVGGQ